LIRDSILIKDAIPSSLRLTERLRKAGWPVELIYLALPNVGLSRLRVAERVAHGGHNIPSTDIVRRFPRSLRNLLQVFSPRADSVRCFMNAGAEPELVFEQRGNERAVFHPRWFAHLLQESER
jgi:predicted ABC-type ATPase